MSIVGASGVRRIANAMLTRHGKGAARVAAERLNMMIDRGDWTGRDLWARVVHAIHESDPGIDPHLAQPPERLPGPGDARPTNTRPRCRREYPLARRFGGGSDIAAALSRPAPMAETA